MHTNIARLILVFAAILTAVTAQAESGEIAELFLKNNGNSVGHIWVNGRYQGYVPAGESHYTLREGFVTRDSGVQSDGSVEQTYSHAGWDSSESQVWIRIVHTAGGDTRYETTIEVTGDSEKRAYVWFGETETGSEPNSLVWERATQIPNASAPVMHSEDEVLEGAAETLNSIEFPGTVWKVTVYSGDNGEPSNTEFFRFESDGAWLAAKELSGDWFYRGSYQLENEETIPAVLITEMEGEEGPWRQVLRFEGRIQGRNIEGRWQDTTGYIGKTKLSEGTWIAERQ
jgi:hypothetical protein